MDSQNFNVIEDNKIPLSLEQLRLDHLNSEEKTGLMNIIKKYKDVFYKENGNLSFTNAIKYKIRTTNNVPIQTKSYRYPYIHKGEVQRQIKEMLDKKIIRQSNSPYSAPSARPCKRQKKNRGLS